MNRILIKIYYKSKQLDNQDGGIKEIVEVVFICITGRTMNSLYMDKCLYKHRINHLNSQRNVWIIFFGINTKCHVCTLVALWSLAQIVSLWLIVIFDILCLWLLPVIGHCVACINVPSIYCLYLHRKNSFFFGVVIVWYMNWKRRFRLPAWVWFVWPHLVRMASQWNCSNWMLLYH